MTSINEKLKKLNREESIPIKSNTVWTNEMKKIVASFRERATGYSEDEINKIVDEAVKAVRDEERNKNDSAGS